MASIASTLLRLAPRSAAARSVTAFGATRATTTSTGAVAVSVVSVSSSSSSACPWSPSSIKISISVSRRSLHTVAITATPSPSTRFLNPHISLGSVKPHSARSLTRTMSTSSSNGPPSGLRLKNPAIFVCDMQDKFRNAIHEFDKIVLTTQKLLTFANALSIPIHTTTQTSQKLGQTVPSLLPLLSSPPHDKTRFSMLIPSIADQLPAESSIALVGIESHICITQTALDLRDAGHRVYVIADGVSSCNRGEVAVALDRLRAERGVTVTTSESWMYECLGDAAHPNFKGLFNVVKGAAADTKSVLEVLPPGPKI